MLVGTKGLIISKEVCHVEFFKNANFRVIMANAIGHNKMGHFLDDLKPENCSTPCDFFAHAVCASQENFQK